MPVSTIANRVAKHYDKETELRAKSSAAISATTAEAPIALDATAIRSFKCVVAAEAHTGYAAGSAYWQILVEAATGVAATFVQVGSVILNGTLDNPEIPLSGQSIVSAVPGATHIRVRAVKVGSVGNLIYGAYLSPDC
jgi:hypothetical protein